MEEMVVQAVLRVQAVVAEPLDLLEVLLARQLALVAAQAGMEERVVLEHQHLKAFLSCLLAPLVVPAV
jgi:hypothetical protein